MNSRLLRILQVVVASIAISIDPCSGTILVESDRLAYQDIVRSTSSVNAQPDTGYIAPNECTQISDISCDTDGYINAMYLNSKKYTGQISASFGNLSRLNYLDLSRNSFTGEIPPGILKLPQLQNLYFDGNHLTGTLPAPNCALKYLDVNSNDLIGEISPEYAKCPLVYIDLSGNKFYGRIPEGFATIATLQYLILNNNQFTGPIPIFQKFFYQLSLQSNYLIGEIPKIQGIEVSGSYQDNCLSSTTYNSAVLSRKSDIECAAFCNTTSSVGVCSGFGVCYLNGTQPACMCTQDKVSSNADCIDKPPVVVAPCRGGMLNPCRVGTCLSKDGVDDYTCICPYGYELEKRTTGYPTCISQGYTIQAGDTCYLIHTALRMTLSTFHKLNPGLNCSKLPVGARAVTANVTARNNCRTRYSINSGDTCSSIQNLFKINKLLTYNPGLNCNGLVSGQQVCVQEYGIYEREFLCTKFVATNNTNCTKVVSENRLTPLQLYLYNPGIICPNLSLSPYRVCVRAFSASLLSCTKTVVVRLGDTCASVLSANYGGNATLLAVRNKGFVCEDAYLYAGLSLC